MDHWRPGASSGQGSIRSTGKTARSRLSRLVDGRETGNSVGKEERETDLLSLGHLQGNLHPLLEGLSREGSDLLRAWTRLLRQLISTTCDPCGI